MRQFAFIFNVLFISLFVIITGIGIYLFTIDKPAMKMAFSSIEAQIHETPISTWARIYHLQLSELLLFFSIGYFTITMFLHKANWKILFLALLFLILLLIEQMAGYYFPFGSIISNTEPELIHNLPMSRLRVMASLNYLPWKYIHVAILPIILTTLLLMFLSKLKKQDEC